MKVRYDGPVSVSESVTGQVWHPGDEKDVEHEQAEQLLSHPHFVEVADAPAEPVLPPVDQDYDEY